MSDRLIPLHLIAFDSALAPSTDTGPKGDLRWLPLSALVIDTQYQRAVGKDGRANIRRIVEGFSWSLFSPLVVSRREGGVFAVIDGQHRALAALAHGGIDSVPCLVISASEATEARAFAIINGQVTAVLPTQIYHARLLGGEPKAVALQRACDAAQVRVQKTPMGYYKAGDTLAIGTLEACMRRYGDATLITALQTITQTGNGNPGYVRAPIILATCHVLSENPKWRDAGERLFTAIETVGVGAMYLLAQRKKGEQGGSLRAHYADELIRTLSRAFAATKKAA